MELSQGAFVSTLKFSNLNLQRKRPLQMENWRDVKAKALRNRGKPYQSRDGTLREGKRLPQAGKICGARCELEGCDIDEDTKVLIFTKYYEVGSINIQHTHLAALMNRVQQGLRTRCRYYLPVMGRKVECCRQTFIEVYQISERVVDTLQKKISRGETYIEDGRGKHLNRPRRNDDALKTQMLAHIRSFPTYETHYCRETHGPHYLSPHLNVALMFRLFRAANPDIPDLARKEWLYSKVFKETKLKIGQPKTDTCKTCDLYHVKLQVSSEQEKPALEAELAHHHSLAERAQQSMAEDIRRSRFDASYIVKCIDLQQTLYSPTLTHSDMFYLRQFASLNYCIYDGALDNANMVFWNENDAHRGVDEVASVVLKSIMDDFRPLNVGEERTLVIWSDRCKGQTNNWPFVCALVYLMNRNLFTRVEQKFLTSGHSFLPCDRLFGLIESRKRVSSVMVPDQWCDVIQSSQPSKPFKVTRVAQENIWNIKDVFGPFKKPQSLKVTEIAWLQVDRSTSHLIHTRDQHSTETGWIPHSFLAPNQVGVRYILRTPFVLDTMNEVMLNRKYDSPIPLSAEKKGDIQKIIPFLPLEYRPFYMDLIQE